MTRRAGIAGVGLLLIFAGVLAGCGEVPLPTPIVVTPTPAAPALGDLPPVIFPGFAPQQRQTLTQAEDTANAAPLGPPDWVKVGARLSFYEAAASVAQSRYTYVEDPAGEYYDPVTGKHYRRSDEGTPEDMPTASGDGFAQIDVLAVEGRNVVLSETIYAIDHINNQFVVVSGAGAKVAGATVDGTWIHPKQLAQYAQNGLGGLLILTSKYSLGATVYDAISFVNNAPGAYQSYTYDTKTGILLAATTRTAGATSPIAMAGEDPPQGNTQLTMTRFAGLRQLNKPGLEGTNPTWVSNTTRLQYSGTYYWLNPVSNSESVTFPLDFSVQFSRGGRNWAPYTARVQLQYPGSQPTVSKGVTGSTGLFWYDVTALKTMRAGQMLDKDPVTGAQDQVKSITTQAGKKVVVITSTLLGATTSTTYDQTSGALLAYTRHTSSDGVTIQLLLQNRP